MTFNTDTFSQLLQQAESDERKRTALDLRNSISDQSQRMLNALMPGTVMPIHRHTTSSETIIVLKGSLEQLLYNDHGELIEKHLFSPTAAECGMQIPSGQWHSINVLEPTVIFEAKDGPYAPLADDDIMRR